MDESFKVELYIYDLSKGIAKTLSHLLIGKTLEGIWHTSIVVYNREYFFNSSGVESCIPGSTDLGPPLRIESLGETKVPISIFNEYLKALSSTTFSGSSYDIFKHNCNNFTEELAQFLVGRGIPEYILNLPNEVLNSNLSPQLLALLNQFEARAHVKSKVDKESSSNSEQLNEQIEEARYHSFLLEERRKTFQEKLEARHLKQDRIKLGAMDEVELDNSDKKLTAEQYLALEEEERKEEEEKKKSREPPIVYKDVVDVKTEFDSLINLVDKKLSPDEQHYVEEFSQYMLADEGCWALSDSFLSFVGHLLNNFDIECRVHLLKLLAAAALKDDIILLLHQDRKDHILMNYAYEIDQKSVEEQKALALMMANLFENLSSSEWLLYISEWSYKNQQINNIRVTTKVAVHCLLSDNSDIQEKGVAIIHNLACKEVKTVVFDDITVELTMALLQYFTTKPAEQELFLSMKALCRFTRMSSQEVPQLIQMIGPNPITFKGCSARIDELIEEILTKVH